MKIFCHAILLIFSLTVVGCRAHREVHNEQTRTRTDEIGVELRRVDSLWSSIAERQTIKIEFYPIWDSALYAQTDSCAPLSDGFAMPTRGGRLGPVKSIEVVNETSTATSTLRQADSTAVFKTDTAEAKTVDTHTDARQDNGTVATVAIVAAVAALIYFVIKAFMKK